MAKNSTKYNLTKKTHPFGDLDKLLVIIQLLFFYRVAPRPRLASVTRDCLANPLYGAYQGYLEFRPRISAIGEGST